MKCSIALGFALVVGFGISLYQTSGLTSQLASIRSELMPRDVGLSTTTPIEISMPSLCVTKTKTLPDGTSIEAVFCRQPGEPLADFVARIKAEWLAICEAFE